MRANGDERANISARRDGGDSCAGSDIGRQFADGFGQADPGCAGRYRGLRPEFDVGAIGGAKSDADRSDR